MDDEATQQPSIFSWLLRPFTRQGIQRSVVVGDVHVVASTEKKKLTEKQLALLAKVKSSKDQS